MSGDPREGRVILVGAGPGDPELLTLRGMRALEAADAVIYDALVNPQLLDFAPPDALRINVGKRGHDAPTRSQPETTALLLDLAREGKTVVRLKGGDPFVFGRGGEEAGACADAGIPFEVIPGISSVVGALAYAGIPLTDRRHSASFAVVTGHKDPTKVTAETRWDLLARAADTLVVLMGMHNLEEIVARLLASGREPSTPAAAVMDGTLPSQRVVEAPLSELARRVRQSGLAAPAVVVVGEVVRLRDALAWYERQPLFGRRVLVTRPANQAPELEAALRAAGATAVCVPMLRIEPVSDPGGLDAALERQAAYDAVIFTSANAVRSLAARAAQRGIAFEPLEVVCVGPATAEAARVAGFPVHRVPADRFDQEGLLDAIARGVSLAGRRFLLPRAERGREVLAEGLAAAGASVDVVAVYRTVPAEVDADALRARLRAGELDALTFMSPSAVHHFVSLLDAPSRAAAGGCIIAAIGPVTAKALRDVGLAPDVTPPRAGAAALVDALARHVAAGAPGDTP